MKVLKFGGTSVGSTDSIRQVKRIVERYLQEKQQVAVVVSAQSGITNMLESMGALAAQSDESYKDSLQKMEDTLFALIRTLLQVEKQSKVLAEVKIMLNNLEDILQGVYLLREFSPRIRDLVLSFGERCSAYLIASFFNQEGLHARYVDTRSLVKTDSSFGSAKVDFNETNKRIQGHFQQYPNEVQVITGFISSNDKEQTTTLGRGGSDYTVSIIGAALDSEEVEIWTDVDGVMTTDPRKVKRAFSLPTISYAEAMEMTHFGAKVIYPPTLQPLVRKRIPLRIRNTFNPDFEGTYIGRKASAFPGAVKGISSIEHVVLVNVQGSGLVGVSGVAARLFGALARRKVNIILITQASSEHSICFAVSPNDAQIAKLAIDEEFATELEHQKLDPIVLQEGLSVIAAIGENMRNMPGIASKFFGALGKNGINVSAIAQGSSELNISAVIDQRNLSKALNALHGSFFQSETRNLHVFLVGTGLIGSTLLAQMKRQEEFFLKERKLRILVVAISNSRKMAFNSEGIEIDAWRETLDQGEPADMDGFIKRMRELNLPNSVFIDSTASEKPTQHYKDILRNQVSIVTPNKKANSMQYSLYESLQQLAIHYNVKYLYETTVGAGLPVINSLQSIRLSGDEILKVEGVLSGTLSYIFNEYDGSIPFSELVKQAKEKGYTEPDPRDDLNGMDVARKILILARESGLKMEMSDIDLTQFLPKSCFAPESVAGFFEELQKSDAAMKAMYEDAKAKGEVLRFIASLENGKAKVSLDTVGADHPFYSLSGSDNVIAYTTARYKERPLVVKGPGAGAEVTAAGVFADLLALSSYLAG